ncbi:MAG: Gfo/Idh/MocA family protein [Pirellulaceae bacterium]
MTPSSRRNFLQQLSVAALASQGARHLAAQPTASRPRIRIGQIGVGHAHASKLGVYRQSADYEVVGLVEPDAELRQKAASQPAFRDVPHMTQEQLLNVPGLQAVLVETRVRDLLPAAEACVAAGKHVHIDKPAGESLDHFRRILAAAELQHLMVQMGYMYRFNPAIVKLREMLRAGWLGDVFELHAVMSKVVAPSERARLAEYPGGIMFELGCHLIDLVVGLLGQPARVTPFAQHAASLDDKLVDNMLAVFTYDRAVASVKTAAMEVDGFERRHLVVCGSEGTFHIQPLDNPRARLTLSRPRGDFRQGYQDVTFPRYTRYVDDAADMARVIRGEKSHDFTYAHDLAVQQTVLQACGLPLTP